MGELSGLGASERLKANVIEQALHIILCRYGDLVVKQAKWIFTRRCRKFEVPYHIKIFEYTRCLKLAANTYTRDLLLR